MSQLSRSNCKESFDLVLRVRDKEIPVHKLKLVGASKYFESLFSGCFADSGKNVIELDQFETAMVEMVVEFIYTGKMELSIDMIVDIFEVADFLQVENLLQLCDRFFIDSASSVNCVDFWKFADFYGRTSLRTHLQTYIWKSFEDVTKTTDFLELEFEDLKSLMTDPEMSEFEQLHPYEMMFSASMLWINHDVTMRRVYIGRLLELLKDEEIRDSFLQDVIMPNELITEYFANGRWLVEKCYGSS
ncbi:kelch-like protein 28 [Hermetia illucens]|uniref:kelch-like protein 28 n=1 Tax=Hermetia illucens TaxID=343691 RepID=UPI0018CC0357|nr:kelch-like protein 28 [Hermetia illucens]